MQAALAGVVIGAQPLRGQGQRLVHAVADGAVAHGRKQNGRLCQQVRRQGGVQRAGGRAPHRGGPLAQVDGRLHGLAQGVYGGVCNLRGVQHQAVPIHRQGAGAAHGAQQHAARLRLAVHLFQGALPPHRAAAKAVGRGRYLQSAHGAARHTALAVHAPGGVGRQGACFRVRLVHAVGALLCAHAALHARRAAQHGKARAKPPRCHSCTPLFSRTITGSPPRGARRVSSCGATVRMAASSLAA